MAAHIQTWGTYWLHGGSGGPASGFDAWGSIQVYLDSQSQANNTSSIFIDHYVYAKVTGTNLGVTTTVTSKYRANNGSFGGTYKSVSKSITIYPDDGEKSFYIGRTWHTITHNADGTAKLYVQGSISCDGSSTTSSFNKSITTIPRMSTITATRANIGEVSQLTISRKNTGYTHSIQYSFGSLSGYILADGSTTTSETKISAESIGFTVPTTFYAQIPSAKEGLCTLTIKTYNGSTQIGSAQTGTFYADVADNASNRPGLSTSVVDINDKTKALTDVDTKLIKGYSTARVTYSASGKNSASIKTVTINGATVTSSPKDYTYFNANTISVVATDSRGFSTTATPTYTMLEYFDPSISMSAKRTAPTENEIKMSFSGNFYNKSFGTVANALTLSWVYRIKGDASWKTGGNLTLNTHYKISGDTFYSGTGSSASEISLGKIFSYENTYEIGITYGDKLYGPVTTVTTVSKGKPVIGWKDKKVTINGDLLTNGKIDTTLLEITSNGSVIGTLSVNSQGLLVVNGKQTTPVSLINATIPTYSQSTSSWTNYQLQINSNILIGNDFSISNNVITITGDNVEYISVSALLKYIIGASSANRAIRITLNDVQITNDYYTYTHASDSWGTDMISNLVVPAKKGDVLKFYFVRGGASSATTNIGGGYVTVSVVKYK